MEPILYELSTRMINLADCLYATSWLVYLMISNRDDYNIFEYSDIALIFEDQNLACTTTANLAMNCLLIIYKSILFEGLTSNSILNLDYRQILDNSESFNECNKENEVKENKFTKIKKKHIFPRLVRKRSQIWTDKIFDREKSESRRNLLNN